MTVSDIKKEDKSQLIKQLALESGFDFCGISEAIFLEEEAPRLEQWLKKGYHGKMQYMENHFDKRLDPRLLVDGAKSVISLLFNYYPENSQAANSPYLISKYAYGSDYHFVVKDRMRELVNAMQEKLGTFHARLFVDSAPVMDKAWAKRSGLGWIGKNANLINTSAGSFFFIAEIISDIELAPDGPLKDYCGTCTRCIDACPTDALATPYVVDGSKCISYFTIELKEDIPASFKDSYEKWVFGCDICQDVCPWNRFSKPHSVPEFAPRSFINWEKQEWEELTEVVFLETFRNSAVKRTKLEGLKRNIEFVKKIPPDVGGIHNQVKE